MSYLGDYTEDYATLNFKFTTRDSTGLPTTLLGSPVVSVYSGSATGTETTTGVTLAVDFDGVTGLNNVLIDLSADAFYIVATDYHVVITTGTVDGVSVVGEVVGEFSIENRFDEANVTQWLGQAVSASVNGIPAVDVTYIHGSALTETAGQLAAGFVKLFDVATPLLVASDVMRGTDLAATAAKHLAYTQLKCRKDDAIETDLAAELAEINADEGSGPGDFMNETDALEALRDRGDLAWLTGGGGGATEAYTTTAWTRTIGDDDGGTGSDTISVNGTYFATGEVNAGTFLEVDATFTIGAGETALSCDFWGFYDGGGAHMITVLALDVGTSIYEPLDVIGLGSSVVKARFLFSPGHTNQANGEVKMKFLHAGSATGVPSHVFNVDKCQVNSSLEFTTAAKLLAYFQLALRSDAAIATDKATELGEINTDEGSGPGDYDNTDDALEAIRDRGDVEWITATGFNVVVPDVAGTAAGLHSTTDTLILDVPTVAEFEARTILAADYFDPANDAVASVTLVDTLTTYTSNTPQTGDCYAIVNNGTYGNAAIRTRGDIAWITATSTTVSDKTGFKLASDGLDLVTDWTVNITGDITGNLSGSVGSVTAAVSANLTQIQGETLTGTAAQVAAGWTYFWDVVTPTKDMNDVGVAGSGLSQQDVRDAMQLAPTTDSPVATSVDKHLDDIQAKTDTIGAGTYTVSSPVSAEGEIEITQGDDWPAGNELTITKTSYTGPSLTGGTVDLRLETTENYNAAPGTNALTVAGTVTQSGTTVTCIFVLTDVQTGALDPAPPDGRYNYTYQCVATTTGGFIITVGLGAFEVVREVTA